MKRVSQRSQATNSAFGTPRASHGLAIVEDYIRRHDGAMIKDCDEDINALLILGGLFSTILTAFISVSLGWLNEDFTQTTAQLLQQISTQLVDNSSRSVVAEPSPFEVASVDVTINVLWFLSLVLCLVASLFGMIVKQWLREYSMWETEPRQDAIWLRQIRYQAFIRWKVPFIVALLPGLLEIALVLFMAGIVAMLWTLNSVLYRIISTLSAFFAVVAFAVVLAPAFFPHCPYRSPLGWGWVILWDTLIRISFRLLWLTGQCSPPALRDRLSRHQPLEDWKERDLHLDIVGYGGLLPGLCYGMHTSKLVHFIDATVWAYERSQDDDILEDFRLSTGNDINASTCLQVPLHALCRKFSIKYEDLLADIRLQYTHGTGDNVEAYVLRLSHRFDVLDLTHIPWQGTVFVEIMGLVLLGDVQSFSLLLTRPAPDSPTYLQIQAFLNALILLSHIARTLPFSKVKAAYVNFLTGFYERTLQENSDGSQKNLQQFRTIVIQILRKLGSIRLTGSHILVDMEHTHMAFREYARLAIHVFGTNSDYTNAEGRHLFVTLSNIAIRRCDRWFTSLHNQEDLCCLVECIEKAVCISLRAHIPNCGYYADLPWICALSRAAGSNSGLCTYIPHSLLRMLEESIAAGLIAEERSQSHLKQLIEHCTADEAIQSIESSPSAMSRESDDPSRDMSQSNPSPYTLPGSLSPSPKPLPALPYYKISDDAKHPNSCNIPLLREFPSSGTLAGTTPVDTPQCSTTALDQTFSPTGDDGGQMGQVLTFV